MTDNRAKESRYEKQKGQVIDDNVNFSFALRQFQVQGVFIEKDDVQ